MTWLEMPKILERLSKETLDTLAARRLGDAEKLHVCSSLNITSMHDEENNRRIAAFASDFQWPLDTPDELLLECLVRICQAKAFVEFVLSAAKEIPMNHVAQRNDLPDELLIRWLLIDYWHYAGVWRQIFHLYSRSKSTVS
jgi:hypothetical protein